MGRTAPRHHIKTTRGRKRLRRIGLVAAPGVLVLLLACLAMPPTMASAAGSTTLDDVLGLTRQQFVESVEGNWASSYEGTPYEGWYLNEQLYPSWNDGMFWPRGNPSPTGHVGMNCGGFVARALTDAGADDYSSAFMADWWNGAPNASDGLGQAAGHYANARTFWRLAKTYGVEMYEFSDKWALLDSGLAVKGDIIVMIDDFDSGGFDDFGTYHAHAQDSHIGIYWGDENDRDKFLHAAHDIQMTAESTVSGCVESTVQPKCWGSRFYLVKFRDYGGITLEKRSALPDISDGNASYALEGARYGVFATQVEAAAHDASGALETFTTDAAGTWKSGRIFDPGTYYVAETEAPKGYALDGTVYEVEVVPGSDTAVNGGVVSDTPQHEKPSTWALKRDAETDDGGPQGDATLAGAEFEVRYYDGLYDASSLPAKATRTWTVKTGADGVARASDALKVSGDDFFHDADGAVVLPIGTVAVRETKAPDGYRLGDGELYVATITSNGSSANSVSPFAAPTVEDYVQRGGVAVGKVDRQTGLPYAQGSASLEGAMFEVVSESANAVVVDGKAYGKGDVVARVVAQQADGAVVARTTADALPVGSYSVREVAAGTGYLFDAESRSWRASFAVEDDGVVVDLTSPDDAASNLVVRGDFEFSKVDGGDMARMGAIPFLLTSKTTGESHVVVTDENGMLSTAASWNAHSQNTNANDAALSPALEQAAPVDEGDAGDVEAEPVLMKVMADAGTETPALDGGDDAESEGGDEAGNGDEAGGETDADANGEANADGEGEDAETPEAEEGADPAIVVDESMLDPSAGVWFSGSAETACAPDDDLGALPYDTYTVTELPVSANAGYQLVSFDVTVSRNARELDLGTVDDNVIPEEPEEPKEPTEPEPVPEPAIGTTLTDPSSESHRVVLGDSVTLVDTVSYEGLTPGKAYLVEGTLHMRDAQGADAGTLKDVTGGEVAAHATFVPEKADGSVDVEFAFAAADLDGRSLVAFERLSCAGEIVASHEDIGDEGQTVTCEKETPPTEPEKPTEPETPQPSTPTQPEKTPGTSNSKAVTMPVLGDPMLTAMAIALALALLAGGVGIVSYTRSRNAMEVPTGPNLEPTDFMTGQSPTCEPRARARRRTRRGPAHARRR